MRHVDCMACLTAGVALPNGVVDAGGIVHYVKWCVGTQRKGCYKLCDFEEEQVWKGTVAVDVNKLIPVEDP
jgi:hypothetical protein